MPRSVLLGCFSIIRPTRNHSKKLRPSGARYTIDGVAARKKKVWLRELTVQAADKLQPEEKVDLCCGRQKITTQVKSSEENNMQSDRYCQAAVLCMGLGQREKVADCHHQQYEGWSQNLATPIDLIGIGSLW